MFSSRYERRFYFSEDFLKYEPFVDPKVSKKINDILLLRSKNYKNSLLVIRQ